MINKNNFRNFCVAPNASVREVIQKIDRTRHGIALVVDAENRLMGTVTDGDIRRAVLANVSLEAPVGALLDRKKGTLYDKPTTAPIGAPAENYLATLRKFSLMHLPLIDANQKLAGLVTMDDLITPDEPKIHAVLMAGGKGSRLFPLTKETPKPMLQVGDRPLMETIIEQLSLAGIKRVSIATHHQQPKITDHFGDGRNFNMQVSYLPEDEPLGTGGALGALADSNDTILVMNGDILTDLDFRRMLSFHREHEADLTVAVRQYDFQVPYGVVEADGQSVRAITEKPVYNFFVNAGIYLLEPSARKYLPADGKRFDMPDLIRAMIDKKATVVSFPVLEQWIDIGHHEDYAKAQQMAEKMRVHK